MALGAPGPPRPRKRQIFKQIQNHLSARPPRHQKPAPETNSLKPFGGPEECKPTPSTQLHSSAASLLRCVQAPPACSYVPQGQQPRYPKGTAAVFQKVRCSSRLPGTPIDRWGPPRTSIFMKGQPRGPSLKPNVGERSTPPDCLRVSRQPSVRSIKSATLRRVRSQHQKCHPASCAFAALFRSWVPEASAANLPLKSVYLGATLLRSSGANPAHQRPRKISTTDKLESQTVAGEASRRIAFGRPRTPTNQTVSWFPRNPARYSGPAR